MDLFTALEGSQVVCDSIAKASPPVQVGPSRDAYWKFGNTAVASTWYILSRIESQGLVKKGDRLWQIGKVHFPSIISG